MESLLIIGICLGFFTFIYFLFQIKKKKSSKFVAILMLTVIAYMIYKLILFSSPVSGNKYLTAFNSLPLLFGPLLFFYVLMEVNEERVFRISDILHIIPFIIFIIILLFSNLTPQGPHGFQNDRFLHESRGHHGSHGPPGNIRNGREKDRELEMDMDMDHGIHPPHRGRHHPPPPHGPELSLKSIQHLFFKGLGFFIVSFIIYSLFIFKLLRKHRENIKNYFSYETELLNLKWIEYILSAFIFSALFMFLAFFLSPALKKHHILNPELAEIYSFIFFIFIFSIFSIKQPPIFKDISDDASENDALEKYKKSGLTREEEDSIMKQIDFYMESEKLFLNGDMTINDLSEKLNISRHHISQVINVKCGVNFYAYVNNYRINDVIEKMKDDDYKDYSLLSIAYDSGFNTKSAFNRIFKENTGKTPSDFRSTV